MDLYALLEIILGYLGPKGGLLVSEIKNGQHCHEYDRHHRQHDHHQHHDHDHGHGHDDDYSNDFDMSPAEFLERIDKAPLHDKIIDVRLPWELVQARIADSISIPLSNLHKGLVEFDRAEVYYVICSSGIRSSYAAAFMVSLGFENVYNIQGGLNGIVACLGEKKQVPAWLLLESAEFPKR